MAFAGFFRPPPRIEVHFGRIKVNVCIDDHGAVVTNCPPRHKPCLANGMHGHCHGDERAIPSAGTASRPGGGFTLAR